jgi:hypothetical protein
LCSNTDFNGEQVFIFSLSETFLFLIPKTEKHLSIVLPLTRDSVVGIATGYGLDNRGSEFESQWGQEFSVLHLIQTGSGVHPTSCPMGTGGSFLAGKVAGA